MQKIINGKKYDTQTAVACGTYVEPILFTKCETFITLYRKANGEYFLYEYWREMIFIVEVLSVYEYENAFGQVSE